MARVKRTSKASLAYSDELRKISVIGYYTKFPLLNLRSGSAGNRLQSLLVSITFATSVSSLITAFERNG